MPPLLGIMPPHAAIGRNSKMFIINSEGIENITKGD
jgi:hypothetical protein